VPGRRRLAARDPLEEREPARELAHGLQQAGVELRLRQGLAAGREQRVPEVEGVVRELEVEPGALPLLELDAAGSTKCARRAVSVMARAL
jgi:hypothetical protein